MDVLQFWLNHLVKFIDMIYANWVDKIKDRSFILMDYQLSKAQSSTVRKHGQWRSKSFNFQLSHSVL